MLRLTTTTIIAIVGWGSAAQSASWTLNDAFNEMSSELIQCGAFYSVSASCAERSDAEDIAAGGRRSASSAFELGFIAGQKGGMMSNAMLSEEKLDLNDLMDTIHHECKNIAILIEQHRMSCKSYVEHPDLRMKELVQGPPPKGP